MHLIKRIAEIIFYMALAGILIFSLQADKKSFLLQQEDIYNRIGYPPAVGQLSPDFLVTDSEENEKSSAELFGNGRTIIIFSTPGCEFLNDLLQELCSTDIPAKKINIIFFDADENNLHHVADFIGEYPNFNFYVEIAHSVAWSYKIKNTPTLFIYDNNGFILYRRIGATNENEQILTQIEKLVLGAN